SSAGKPELQSYPTTLLSGTVTTNTTVAASMMAVGQTGTQPQSLELSNGTPTTASVNRATIQIFASGKFSIGANPDNPSATSFIGEVFDVGVAAFPAGTQPTSAQITALHAILHAKY